ncbi:MAG: dienelactone hydrolase family protein [Bacteroidetes bacterium]|nr:dienelactone hydrolase family protein [Bacteroidota bacterium]
MDQRIINLYDEYTHKPLSREEFLKRLSVLTGSMTAALALLPSIEVNQAKAGTIVQDDPRLRTERITYEGDGTTMKGYLAIPAEGKKFAAVMVVHENRGLNAHIEDVTRRIALAGFIGFAPDALSPFGGAPEDADKARDLFTKLDAVKNLNSFLKGFEYLKERKECNKRFGAIGFCWGGALVNQLAVHFQDLKAAVPFYGRQPEMEDVTKIKASLMIHYAENDERINAGISAYETELKRSGKDFVQYVYPGTQHAFHNDTAPTRYNEAAAKLAWTRSMDFFKEKLG